MVLGGEAKGARRFPGPDLFDARVDACDPGRDELGPLGVGLRRGVEVCLATEGCGEVWLVPEYTGRDDRKEISVRDAATLAAVCSAFPGARVTSYERPTADDAS